MPAKPKRPRASNPPGLVTTRPEDFKAFDAAMELVDLAIRAGYPGAVVGFVLPSGGTMTVHRGNLRGLGNDLRGCVAQSIRDADGGAR